ncbi:MAG: metallophosphoesterase [Clostridia bacterium]|nr:metallophosphoesterase [Clostridia bacterium]
MALYAIGDLHLSLSVEKSMTVFGGAWENYVEKIETKWREKVREKDVVVLLGDVSWGISFDECREDFLFIHRLPGRKIILKGNHDYYWTTMKKMNAFLEEIGADSVSFLFNNSFTYRGEDGEAAICGTRGWFYEEDGDDKVYRRELGRLETSLSAAEKGLEKLAFLHYPPFGVGDPRSQVTDLLEKYGVRRAWYGHLHGAALRGVRAETSFRGICYRLASADFIGFDPVRILLTPPSGAENGGINPAGTKETP